ncbi:MAG TPA: ABC transporter ATP-binding protein, partial [Acidimicrobiaceae bacterium]|nr:ABC transporter ATP-binding protein [Acidimicrobiaceae bacterium]
MNLNEGTLAGTNLTLGSHTIELSADVFEKRPGLKEFDGRDIIVGIRPEDLE